MEFTIITVETDKKHLHVIVEELQPKTVIFISPHAEDQKVKEAINYLSNTFGRHLLLKKYNIDKLDVVKNTKEITDLIDKESSLGNQVIIYITEHREYSFCLSYGAYSRSKDIKRIVAVNRKGDIVDLPVLRYHLSTNKIKLLKQLNEKEQTLQSLSENLNLSEGMIYHHIRELRNINLIKKDELDITTAGRLAII